MHSQKLATFRATPRALAWAVLLGVAILPQAGCVRRSLTINTEPQGALIWLNDEEVGRSPVTIDFLWYGDYGIIARLEGWQTLITHEEIVAPWYQLPGVDFVTEVLYPGWLHDAREMHFALAPESLPAAEDLRARAAEFRERVLSEAE